MSRPGFSAQPLPVLAALCDQPPQWQHGYALARQTGLKSGTLYPILIRLAGRGLVEARWQDEPQPGRPRRHLYRPPTAARAATRAPGGRAAVQGWCHEHAEPGGAARRAAGLGRDGLGGGARGAAGGPPGSG